MKTTALILLLAGLGLGAALQLPAADTTSANDLALRDALRQVTLGKTNVSGATPATKSNPNPTAPAYAPQPDSILTEPAGDAPAPTDSPEPSTTPAVTAPPAPAPVPVAKTPTVVPAADSAAAVSPAPPVSTPGMRRLRRPTAPAPVPIAAATSTDTTTATPVEPLIAAGQINFSAADLNLVLGLYAELVNRTILRAPSLPNPQIVLKTQTALTRAEAIEALNAIFALNGIAMINIGDKFVKAVPVGQADAAGAMIGRGDGSDLPDMGQHVTQIIQLKYAKPSEVVPVLQAFGSTKSVFPVESSGMIIVRDFAENVKRMLEVVKDIDVTVQSEFVSEVIPIKYAQATDIASALSSVSGSGSSGTSVGAGATRTSAPAAGTGLNRPGGNTINRPGYTPGQTGAPATGTPSSTANFSDRLKSIINRAASSGDIQIMGQNKIIADERTNSLLVFASRQDMDTIKDIIAKLDIVLAQVLIEAIIMEVSLGDNQNIGVSYAATKFQQNGDLSSIGALKNGTFLSPGSFANVATNGLNNLASGFSYFGSLSDGLDVTATAIAGDSKVNVLSRPTIQTSHGVQASLFIGDTVPYITGTTYGDLNGNTSRSVYEEKSVGINLQVTPLINPDGLVVMDIQQDIEQLGTPTTIDGNPVPTTTKRTASAKIAVKDRQTVILGGFISTTKTTSRSGIPLLKDIPLLGYLFRSTDDNNKRVELVVLMKPTVLPSPESAAMMATERRNSMPGIRHAEADEKKENERLLRKTRRDGDEPEATYSQPPPSQ